MKNPAKPCILKPKACYYTNISQSCIQVFCHILDKESLGEQMGLLDSRKHHSLLNLDV